jgi:Actinobacteria/chloroflexi VLRF1 release factor
MENGLPGQTRWLDVAPARLPGWLESFADRHGGLAGDPEHGPAAVVFRAADGAIAECHIPFPPLPPQSPVGASGDRARGGSAGAGRSGEGGADGGGVDGVGVGGGPVGEGPVRREAGADLAGKEPGATAAQMAAHALADRTVGVLLVRLGGYAAGVFAGPDQHLAASKVGSRLVHGRSAAGGQSQRRFARRREKQASEALGAAADTAAAVFGPYNGRLDAVVLGGDKRAMSGLADDPRLRPFLDLAVDRFLTVPDPRLAVLKGTPRMFTAIRIRLTDPTTP